MRYLALLPLCLPPLLALPALAAPPIRQEVRIEAKNFGNRKVAPGCQLDFQIRQLPPDGSQNLYALTLLFHKRGEATLYAMKGTATAEQAAVDSMLKPALPVPDTLPLMVGKGRRVVYPFRLPALGAAPGNFVSIAPVSTMLPQAMAMARGETVQIDWRPAGANENFTVAGSAGLPPKERDEFTACVKALGLDPGKAQ